MSKYGTVLWYNRMKNYGFISSENESEDFYVHKTSLENAKRLKEGQSVKFDEGEPLKGHKVAINVYVD